MTIEARGMQPLPVLLPDARNETGIVADIGARIQYAKQARLQLNGTETGWGMDVFNNLSLNLPYPNEPFSRRAILKMRKQYDIPYGQQPAIERGHSAIFLQMTPREFYGVFDARMEEHGITDDKVEPLIQRGREDKDALYELLLPVYIDMRASGFSHYPDLTV